LSYQKYAEFGTHFRRNKKKSDDYLKKRLQHKPTAEEKLPVHAIRESVYADKDLKLPRLGKKGSNPPPNQAINQLSMAEIVEQSDIKPDIDEDLSEEKVQDTPEFNLKNIKKINQLFASQVKVSVAPLIKMADMEISGMEIKVKLTEQQDSLLGELKIDWQTYLRNSFKDKNVKLNIIIHENQAIQRQAYTASEQFTELMNENEEFRNLVQTLKLRLKN